MSLRTWGWGRIALVWLGYWLLLVVGVLAWAWRDARRLTREYGNADFLHGYAVAGPAATLALFGPPLLLTVIWLWARRR
jgi:hypothetical protein